MWEKIIGNFDKYNREARIYPTFLAFFPAYILLLSLNQFFPGLNLYLKVIFGFSVCSILIYILSDVIRNLGKMLETKIFGNELFFPTTELILHSNKQFSQDKKQKIYLKIQKEFNISLLTETQEKKDGVEARKRIKEAIGQIRQKLKDGRLLLQYNIRYGFWRNFCAASPLALILSLIVIIMEEFILKDFGFLILFIILAPIYLILWLLRKKILYYFAYQYAEQFYLEYLAN